MLSGAATHLPLIHHPVFLLSLPLFLFFLLSSFPSLFSPHCQLLLFRLWKTDFSFLGITKVSNGFLWVLPCRVRYVVSITTGERTWKGAQQFKVMCSLVCWQLSSQHVRFIHGVA
ncbi:hypothetical protein CXB51_013998 [Gossypium anomalum]|uniref:Uncharacterized protein n=1 Tax=Gossypium anomalum TaxID=47600 RepID=A0A8J6D0W7_9ROSI|nr:hypothetical protein CXB51_013998 [Gossypium anomalum]